MKDLWLRNKKSKFNIEFKIMLEVLAFMVVVALCIAVHAASDNSDNTDSNAISSQEGLFDPFTLSTIVPVMESSSGTVILGDPTTRPAIWIPFRPPVRSPFRPPLVSGKPPWPPEPLSQKGGLLITKN